MPPPNVNFDRRGSTDKRASRQTTPQHWEQSPPHRQLPPPRQSRYPKRKRTSNQHTISPPSFVDRGSPQRNRLQQQTNKRKVKATYQYICGHFTEGFGKCPKNFSGNSKLQRHKKRHIPTSFQCDICGEYYPTERSLKKHKTTNHEATPPPPGEYSCNHYSEEFGKCPETFVYKGHLGRHKKSHIPTSFQCDICGGYYPDERWLKIHKTTKHKITAPPQEYPCNHYTEGFGKCPRIFPANCELQQHKKRHISTPFQCDICGEYFSDDRILKTHKTTKHEIIAPPQEYRCNHPSEEFGECAGNFRSKGHLEKHKKCHIPTPFRCDICGRYYSSNRYLEAHRTREEH